MTSIPLFDITEWIVWIIIGIYFGSNPVSASDGVSARIATRLLWCYSFCARNCMRDMIHGVLEALNVKCMHPCGSFIVWTGRFTVLPRHEWRSGIPSGSNQLRDKGEGWAKVISQTRIHTYPIGGLCLLFAKDGCWSERYLKPNLHRFSHYVR